MTIDSGKRRVIQQKTCHPTKCEQSIVPQAKSACEHVQKRPDMVQTAITCTNSVHRSPSTADVHSFAPPFILPFPRNGSSRQTSVENPQEIFTRARERARQMTLPYAGALLPAEACALMQNLPEARLVDVRTRAELEWVGKVPGSVSVEWNTWP